MIVYIAPKGYSIQKAERYNDVEKFCSFKNAYGEDVIQITRRDNAIVFQQNCYDVWITNDDK